MYICFHQFTQAVPSFQKFSDIIRSPQNLYNRKVSENEL